MCFSSPLSVRFHIHRGNGKEIWQSHDADQTRMPYRIKKRWFVKQRKERADENEMRLQIRRSLEKLIKGYMAACPLFARLAYFVKRSIVSGILAETAMLLGRLGFTHSEIEREFVIDTRNHVVYLVNSKAACSSIKAAMYETLYPDDYSIHIHSSEGCIKKADVLNDEEKTWDSFTFVRNPYERLVSAYESKYHNDAKKGVPNSLVPYLHGYIADDRGFESFVRRICRIPDAMLDRHFNSQYLLTHDTDGTPIVRFIGKYEELAQNFAVISEKYGYRALPHYNSSGGETRDWRTYYSAKTAELVHGKYQRDFEAFGYEHYYTELMESFKAAP